MKVTGSIIHQVSEVLKYYSKSKKEWPTADDFERAVLRCGFKFKPKERKFSIGNGIVKVYY